MPLSDTAIRNAKARDKAYKLADGSGLYLLVSPNNKKYWRWKYRFNGREKLLGFGIYPDVSLGQARDHRDQARKLLAAGIDPSAARKAEKAARKNSFKAIAMEWLNQQQKIWAEATYKKAESLFESTIFPALGKPPIHTIETPEILDLLRKLEANGLYETAHRTRQRISQVFRYAIVTRRAKRDPASDLKGALVPVKTTHHAAITDPAEVGALLRSIDGYSGQPVTRAALQMLALTFVRSVELRRAEWPEFDLKESMWRVPRDRMKMKETHMVPLSSQAKMVLERLKPLTGHRRYVFEGLRPGKPLSENTLNAALRYLGYANDVMTAHGFRTVANTILNEQGWNPDAIERQLAHSERNQVRAAYNRAQYLPERRKMMQHWADYLDSLRTGAKVVSIRAG